MNSFRSLICMALCLPALLTIGGCETTTSGGSVGADRSQLMLVSSQELDQMAAQAYAKLLAEASAKGTLNRDQGMLRRVRTIASRIEPQTRAFRADAPGWKWEVNVITSDELNAFCMPGGKIAFYHGILDKLQLTDDEVAMVMGHEIAHALREHARERMGKSEATNVIASIGSALASAYFKVDPSVTDAVARQGANLLTLKFSREDETEADLVGMELAARAGYNPRAGVTLWQKMSAANKGAPPQWLSTHPSGASRIKQIENNLPKVMPLYEKSEQARQ